MKTIDLAAASAALTHKSEPWINTAAACEHLDISVPTIRRWIKAKKLTPHRTPTGELRFRRSQLDAIIS